MRVGVTGASGFIGRSLVTALQERGDTVVTFVRPSSPRLGDRSVRWDPERGLVDDVDLRAIGGLDATVNLAGTGIGDRRWSPSYKERILRSRVESTSLLVRVLNELPGGVGVLASASAVGFYGSRGDEVLDEESVRGEGFLASVCAEWEGVARNLKSGAVALLRTGAVLGRGGALAKELPLFRAGVGGPFGSGCQWMSPISLLDEVRAVLWILDQRQDGPVNIVSPSPTTNREFTQALASTLRRPAVLRIPTVAFDVLFGKEMAHELILASQRATPGVLGASDFRFEHPDAASALRWALSTPGLSK